MNIECVKDKLLKDLSKAEKITGKNVTLPILSCILLDASDSILTITSTNLDLGIEIKIPVKVNKPGKVAVSGVVLNNFISNLSNDKNINLELVDNILNVSTKHSKAQIKTFPIDDFPSIPKVSKETSFNINTPDLIKGLKSVMYSASVSTIRPVLSSILIYSEEDKLFFVGTDSFRLAEKSIKIKKHIDIEPILIPFKNIPEIIRSLEDIKNDINVFINQNQIAFVYDDMYLTSRVIDGNFPDYKQIIPKDAKTEVVVLKQDLINALKISNIFSDKFSKVVFNISQKNKSFTINTKNLDIGENTHSIDSVIKGDDIEISFNYKYIIDCFQSIDSDSVTLQFFDINKPMVIKGVSDDTFIYLVMPMNK